MSKIPPVDEFFMEYLDVDCDFMESVREQLDKCSGFNLGTITDTMIEFAKLHVQAALEAALEEVPYGGSDEVRYEDVVGILTCYPLENIK